jgi:hypothetical protein
MAQVKIAEQKLLDQNSEVDGRKNLLETSKFDN